MCLQKASRHWSTCSLLSFTPNIVCQSHPRGCEMTKSAQQQDILLSLNVQLKGTVNLHEAKLTTDNRASKENIDVSSLLVLT